MGPKRPCEDPIIPPLTLWINQSSVAWGNSYCNCLRLCKPCRVKYKYIDVMHYIV